MVLMPECLDDYVSEDNPVRLIDAFVDTLDMKTCGFKKAEAASEGRPPYAPSMLVKLYVYCYFNGIRSSRKIARETSRNVEVMWLTGKLSPDFRTISDFRKVHGDALKAVFRQWNLFCSGQGLVGNECVSVDGSKFKAVNSKSNNFTAQKLDDRLRRIDAHIAKFMSEMDRADAEESYERRLSKERIAEKIQELRERKLRYEGYLDQLEQSGDTQMSLTDPESRLMKFKDGFEVGFNVQTAVDDRHHLITGFAVTSSPVDNGLLHDMAQGVKSDFGLVTIETVADNGYHDRDDMARCLESGIVPNVNPDRNSGSFELQVDHEPTEISEATRLSRNPDDIKTCLRSGVIPKIYDGLISDIRVEEIKIREDRPIETRTEMSDEQMKKLALQGYIVRDPRRNLAYCPAGEILRYSGKKSGKKVYCNRFACKNCQKKCCKAAHREAQFAEGQIIIACKAFGHTSFISKRPNRPYTLKKVVRFTFRPDERKLDKRMCLSEHPFGTVKFWDGASYLLLRGIAKATGELALSFLGYNIKRAINVLGMQKLMAALS